METTPSAGQKGIRGEETLIKLIVIKLSVALLLQSQDEWFSVRDWGLILTACCLVLQTLAVYNFPVRKKDDHTEIIFRPGVPTGMYCVLLVPLAILAEVLHISSSNGDYRGNMAEAKFLLATTCSLLLLAPYQLKKIPGILYLVLVNTASLTVILFVLHKGFDILPWLTGFIAVMCCAYYLPQMCPWSFTYGELCIVCHILGSAVFRMASWLDMFISSEDWPVVTDEVTIYIFISVLLVFVILASALVLYWDWCDTIIPFILVFFAFGLIAVGVLMFLTGHNPVLWLFWFIFGDHRRVSLLVWWSAIAIITVISLSLYSQQMSENPSGKVGRASTAARKVFHCVVLAVYVPGLVVDPYFLMLASVVALAALGVLEIARLINVQWLGPAVENSFRVFVDDRDQGPVLLTHIYLLVGLSLPLWLAHNIIVGDIRNFCGVISLGIGDTVACVVGMRYGNSKWPGSKKSLEGTGAAVVAQMLFVIIAYYIGWIEGLSWFQTVFAVFSSSVFEALVSQIDNLALPVYMMAAFGPV